MKKRMPRMLAMMASPPAVTIQRAALSANKRRGAVCFTSLQLRQLVGDVLPEQRKVAVLDHDLLTFLGEHEQQELLDERIERLVGNLVDVDVEKAGERVLPGIDVVGVVADELSAVLRRQLQRLHVR